MDSDSDYNRSHPATTRPQQQQQPQPQPAGQRARPPASLEHYTELDDGYDLTYQLLTTNNNITINGHKARVLVDSGSTHNLLSADLCRRLNVATIITGSRYTVQYADTRSVIEDLIKVHGAKIGLHGSENDLVEINMNLLVARSLKAYDVVIGKPGLAIMSRHHDLHVEYDTNTLHLRQSTLSAPVRVSLREEGQRRERVPRAHLNAHHVDFVCNDTGDDSAQVEIMNDYKDVFSKLTAHEPSRLPSKVNMRFRSMWSPRGPVRYNLSPEDYETMANTIKDLLERGIIEKSHSRFASPAFLVTKEGRDEQGRVRKRLVVDFRALNDALEDQPPPFPPPRAEELARALASSRVLSVMDLADAYYITELDDASREYCAFSCALGTYNFRRAPMGLKLSAATLQSNMHTVLSDIMIKYPNKIHLFADDVIIGGTDIRENRKIVEEVLLAFRKFGVKVNPGKVQLFRDKVAFLGYEISHGSISMQRRADKAGDIPTPTSKTAVRSFTSFLSYFRGHIINLAQRAEPLYRLLRQGNKFEWGTPQQRAFEDLKEQLRDLPTLAPPSSHPSPQLCPLHRRLIGRHRRAPV
jgi:hypothetical protein